MSRASKDKGYRGERELAKLLASCGLTEATRMPLSGSLPDFPGDVRLDGFCVEVKRTERLDLWGSLKQAAAAARGGRVPLLFFRRNHSPWYVVLEAKEWAAREAELRELRRRAALCECPTWYFTELEEAA